MKLKIEYVHHSSFKVETDKIALVFDYFKSNIELPKDKKIYFLQSHSHPDHFSNKIYDFKNVYRYILSDDIPDNGNEKNIFVSVDKEYDFGDFTLYTYGSTDLGLSYLVNIEGKNIFHSGDLNDWYWEMEDDENQRILMHKAFNKELDKIKKKEIDVIFFPVDPRQQGQYDLGGRQVLEKLRPKYFFPMHFWNKYNTTQEFKEKYKDRFEDTKIYNIVEKNQIFNLNI